MTGQTIYLIPDSNCLWANEDGPPMISGSFNSTVKEMDGHYTVKVKIPEVVFRELVAQRKRALKKHIESLAKASTALETITGTRSVVPDEQALAAQIEATLKRQVTELGYDIIPTPVAHIPWEGIISDAIDRVPPFEPYGKSEKGFRDAVIMHSVLYYADTSIAEANTYFVVADKLLLEATKTRNGKLGVFAGMVEFQGHLKLLEEKVDKDIALSIQDDAGVAFFSPKTGRGFLIEKGVRSRIFHELGDMFVRCSDEQSKYTRYGNEKIERTRTSFVRQPSKGVYEWKTVLDFIVEFTSPLGLPSLRKIICLSVIWTGKYFEKSFSDFEFKSLAPEGERIEQIPLVRTSNTSLDESLAALTTPEAWRNSIGHGLSALASSLSGHSEEWEESVRRRQAALASLSGPSSALEESIRRNQAALASFSNPSGALGESMRRSQANLASLAGSSGAWEESIMRSQAALASLTGPSSALEESIKRSQAAFASLAHPSSVLEELIQRRQADIEALIAPQSIVIEEMQRRAKELASHQPTPPVIDSPPQGSADLSGGEGKQ